MRLRLLASLALLAATTGCASLVTGGKLITDPNGPIGTIEIRNRSRVAINVVLLSRCSASSYGLNRMAKGTTIPSGQSGEFRVQAGCWDAAAGRVGYGELRQRLGNVSANGRAVLTVTD